MPIDFRPALEDDGTTFSISNMPTPDGIEEETYHQSLLQEENLNELAEFIEQHPKVTKLEFISFRATAQDFVNLLNRISQTSPNICSIDLTDVDLASQNFEELTKSLQFLNLTKLILLSSGINDEGLKYFINSLNSQNLLELNLCNTNITDEGLKSLANSPKLQHLTDLNLNFTRITDAGLAALANSPKLQNLTTIHWDKMSPDIVEMIAMNLPKIESGWLWK